MVTAERTSIYDGKSLFRQSAGRSLLLVLEKQQAGKGIVQVAQLHGAEARQACILVRLLDDEVAGGRG
jgi:hypothetical protein